MTRDELLTIKRKGQRANDQRPTTKGQRPTTNDLPDPGRPRRAERGYILLMLMLIVTLLAIAAGALAPTIAFQVRRDREEEMVHRGVQYSRAIRRYVKKTGRYPTRLEDLENTNNVRFLRKRYKDPITNADFKLLHVGEVQLTGVAGIAGAAAIGGGTIPGASPLSAGSLNASSVSASSPGPGMQGAGMMNASSPGAAGGMLLGGSPGQAAGAAASGAATTSNAAGTPADNSGSADSSDQTSSDQPSTFQKKMGQSKTGQSETDSDQSAASTDKLSSQVFGGGPIVGVASTSKAATIREYNHKNHYNQWQFIYDPTMDRGGLITTPAQPALQVAAPLQQQNGSSSAGQNPSSFGASGFSASPQSPPPAQPTQQQQQ